MHRLPSFNEIIDNKRNVLMPPSNIHKSNEAKIVVTFASFGKTCIFVHLVTIIGNI
jgi:hypothetical protein